MLFLSETPEALDPVFLKIGPFTIMWYAVLIMTGIIVALLLSIQEGKKIGVEKSFIEDLVLFGVPIAIVGARLYFVVFEWEQYKQNPIDIIKIYEGGLAIYGGVIAAVIWGYFLCKKRGVDFICVLDLGAVGFLIAQAIGRWGNFMNQEAYGREVTRSFLENLHLPKFIIDQMYIQGTYWHPTFLYESLWNLVGFGLLLVLRRTKLIYVGDLGLIYLMWYGTGRFMIEGLRMDSLYLGSTGIRVSQLLSFIMVVAGILVFILRRINHWYPKRYYELLEENRA